MWVYHTQKHIAGKDLICVILLAAKRTVVATAAAAIIYEYTILPTFGSGRMNGFRVKVVAVVWEGIARNGTIRVFFFLSKKNDDDDSACGKIARSNDSLQTDCVYSD